MTQDTLEIRTLARDFAAAELRPHAEAWDAARAPDDGVVGKLAELGFFGMLIPEAEGGMGFDAGVWAAALEELAWGEPAVALMVAHSVQAADLIARHGSAEQRQEWLGAMAGGELIGCIAFTDDEDGAVPVTRAVREAGGWRLRGPKRWVANGDRAGLAVVLADTDAGAAFFAVPLAEGVSVGAAAPTMGLRAVSLVDMEFDTVLEEKHHLGAPDADPRGAGDALGRISAAAIAVGIAQAALDHAVRYAAEREQFGRPIRDFDGIAQKLALMSVRTVGARALVERAAAQSADVAAAAMAKLAAGEAAMEVATEAVQIFGGYGYMRDYPVEKLMRDAKATQIMHGSADALTRAIADALYA